jgi:hypothetical protein
MDLCNILQERLKRPIITVDRSPKILQITQNSVNIAAKLQNLVAENRPETILAFFYCGNHLMTCVIIRTFLFNWT